MSYDAILLVSFGGPEGPDEVMPFLERVTAGRGVPRERLEKVSHHYLALGGVSPINAQNRALLAEMRSSFAKNNIQLPLYWGNRNSAPYLSTTLQEIYSDGHRSVLALVTSAYSSYSGCRQYRENLAAALEELGLTGKLAIDKVRHYFDHPGFVNPFISGVSESLAALMREGSLAPDEIKVFFTAHSIPLSMAHTTGPEERRGEFPEGAYTAQHKATATLIMEGVSRNLGMTAGALPNWELVYQSRSGAPTIAWLEPAIGDAITQAAAEGYKGISVVPIGFVSDHVEVIWDLDNEAKKVADSLNLAFKRVATPGITKEFVEGISDLINERLLNLPKEQRRALSSLGPWADFCSTNCCPNPRAAKAAVAER